VTAVGGSATRLASSFTSRGTPTITLRSLAHGGTGLASPGVARLKPTRRRKACVVGRTIDGKAVAAAVRGEVRERAARLAARGITPGLATVLLGDDRASQSYVGRKGR